MKCIRCQSEVDLNEGYPKKYNMCYSCYWVNPIKFCGVCLSCGTIKEDCLLEDSFCCGWFMKKQYDKSQAEMILESHREHIQLVAELEEALPNEVLEEIQYQVEIGNKIEAIKLYRSFTGLGFIEGKDFLRKIS